MIRLATLAALAALLSACAGAPLLPDATGPLDLDVCYWTAGGYPVPGDFKLRSGGPEFRSVRAFPAGAGTQAGCDVWIDWGEANHPCSASFDVYSGTQENVYSAEVPANCKDLWDPARRSVFFPAAIFALLHPGAPAHDRLMAERELRVRREASMAASRAEAEMLAGRADERAKSGAHREAVELYEKALVKAAGDAALERGIRLRLTAAAAAARPPLVVPEEARRRVVRAQALIAQGSRLTAAADELRQAVAAAPWWTDGYYNLGMAQAAAGEAAAARETLKLFVEAAPRDPKARAARDKIYALEVAKEKAQ